MSIEIVKDATMDHLMNGRFTSKITIPYDVAIWLYVVLVVKVSSLTLSFCSTLGGSHGVPRVHYKGQQGDYYIMVCIENTFSSLVYIHRLEFVYSHVNDMESISCSPAFKCIININFNFNCYR